MAAAAEFDFDIPDTHAFRETARDRAIPCFYMRERQNGRRSREEGRPIFDLVEYVQIITPGQSRSTVDRKVEAGDKARWPERYRAFVARRDRRDRGTALEHWPRLNRAEVAELRALEITTVEQVAGLDDRGLERLGRGAPELRAHARQFLKPQDEAETELRREIERLKAELAARSAEVKTLRTRLDERARPRRAPRPERSA